MLSVNKALLKKSRNLAPVFKPQGGPFYKDGLTWMGEGGGMVVHTMSSSFNQWMEGGRCVGQENIDEQVCALYNIVDYTYLS